MYPENDDISQLAYPVFRGVGAWQSFRDYIFQEEFVNYRKFILSDTNTTLHCRPVLSRRIPEFDHVENFEIPAGEGSKNIETCRNIWTWLMENHADRQSLLINLGGGVVSDLGGFVAGTFKRGIRYINIPTSLIGMADAAIGGKTGINVGNIKNQAGLFYDPLVVLIEPWFLRTITPDHLRSGFAEIIKHALLSGKEDWDAISKVDFNHVEDWALLIDPAINYKIAVVARDPRESGYRRVLNFGHTIGHALESFFQQRDALSILHGDAIAAGMLSESYLSMKVLKMPSHSFSKISSFIVRNFPPCHLDKKEVGPLIDLMLYDKKNKGGEICFTLLEDIGRPMVDVYCSPEVIRTSLEYYREVMAY